MVRTTNSNHWLKNYPNLVKGINLFSAEQLWVSDITYIHIQEGFSYLSLITDAYSRKILGFALHPTLEQQAVSMHYKWCYHKEKKNLNLLLSHSDRGIQYCSGRYTEMLQKEKIAISMTQSGSPI